MRLYGRYFAASQHYCYLVKWPIKRMLAIECPKKREIHCEKIYLFPRSIYQAICRPQVALRAKSSSVGLADFKIARSALSLFSHKLLPGNEYGQFN